MVVPAVLAVYAFSHPWLFAVAALMVARLAFLDWRLSGIVVLVVFVAFLRFHGHNPLPENSRHEAMVLFVEAEREHPRMGVDAQGTRLLVFHEEAGAYAPGDRVVVIGKAQEAEPSGYFGDFDYQRHLRGEGLNGVVYATELLPHESGFSVYSLRREIHRYVQTRFDGSRPYVEAFVLAERGGFDEDTIARVSKAGLMHLFAVSGLHVSLLAFAFYKTLRLFLLDSVFVDSLVAIFLFGFLFLTGFSASVLRASFLAVFLLANKRFGWGFSAVDALSYLTLALLALNPFSPFHAGYQLSFSVSFAILLSRKRLSGKSPLSQSFCVSLVAFLTSLPVVLSMQYSVNVFTVFTNVLYVWFFVLLFLPGAYILFLFPFLEDAFMVLVDVFEGSLLRLDALDLFLMRLYIPAGFWTFVYFVLLYLFFVRLTEKKPWGYSFVSLGLFLTLVAYSPYLQPYQEVTMFPVKGDAFLIRDAHHRCNVLIDTGESDRRESLANALSRLNLRHLDYVFITHKHYDHYGGYESVARRFPIGHTITNQNSAPYENQKIACGNLALYVFPLEFDHPGENDRSLVMRVHVGGESYLFTGDIETPRERTILDNHRLEADILKVPHHGSITSSMPPFLEAVSPREALVSAHWNSRFDHPHPDIMRRYEALNIGLYRVDEDGSVRFRYLFQRRFQKTAF